MSLLSRPISMVPAIFDLQNSHVLPALIRKFHEAKERSDGKIVVWVTATPCREFLYVDGMTDACVYVMNKSGFTDRVNIGVGDDIAIGELAKIVGDVIGYHERLELDTSKPDGTP